MKPAGSLGSNTESVHFMMSPPFALGASAVLIGIAAFFNQLTGAHINLWLLYLAPVVVSTWFARPAFGAVVACISAGTTLVVELTSGTPPAGRMAPYWNAVAELLMFLAVWRILVLLKQSYRKAHELARTDHLTGVANGRHFAEILSLELEYAHRHNRPLSLAYIDIDSFKQVNDQRGHEVGDSLLRLVAQTMKQAVRANDLVARVGGDEFAILFREATQDHVRTVMDRIKYHLSRIAAQNDWPAAFSAGVVTCTGSACLADELIKRADRLMYAVKTAGKNMVKYDLMP